MFESQKQELWREPTLLVHERKFDTALRASQIKNALNRRHDGKSTWDDKLLFESPHFRNDVPIIYTPDCYARILDKTLYNSKDPNKHQRHDSSSYQSAMKFVQQGVGIQAGYMTANNHLPNVVSFKDDLDKMLCNLPTNTQISYITRISQVFAKIVTKSANVNRKFRRNLSERDKQCLYMKDNYHEIPELNMILIWSRKLCCIQIDRYQYLLPRPYILMIHNKLCDLISVLVLCEGTKTSSNPENSTEIVIEMVSEMIALITEYKDDFFTISKDIEAFGIAETLIEADSWVNDEFLRVLNKDIYNKMGFQYVGSDLQKILKKCDVPFRHEIICLSKLMGHPLVDMEEGSRALYKNTTEEYVLDNTLIREATCYIKENYIRNSVVKYGQWPPCDVPLNAHICLKQSNLRNKDPNHPEMVKEYGQVDILDYECIELKQNLHFQKLENVIPYLKDKTISLLRSQVMSSYLQGVRPENSWKETRLLLFYLMHSFAETDHVEFLEEYMKADDLEELADYLVIRIVPKEKEHKVIYRGFGCLQFHNRMRCLAQEKTSMKFLDMFSDEQAMSLSELQILQRMDALRRIKDAYSNHYILYITLDSVAWNNHFRKETVDDMMYDTLDAIHSTRVFSRTHEAYENTLIYVPDECKTYYWKKPKGGVEGQNQPTWVVAFLAHLKVMMKKLNIKYHILCKGDDVRIAFIIPHSQIQPDELRDYKNSIIKEMAEKASLLGHKIKVDECYGSEVYLAFSKNASCSLVELPQSFRKIMKCYGANNAFLPTLDEYIASAFSNAHSSCKVTTNTIGCYVVALFWAYIWVLSSPKYKNLSNDELVALLLVPSVVGGFPIIYLHNMYVRAEYDLLSPFLDILKYVRKRWLSIARCMENFCCAIPGKKDDYRKLFRDPASIPNSQPTLPTAVLRNSIVQPLKSLTKNEHMQELFEAAESDVNDKLVGCLNSSNILSVKVLANLYAATPEGLVMKFIKKFETARSLYEVLVLNKNTFAAKGILKKVIKAEDVLQAWRADRLKMGPTADEISFLHLRVDCPGEFAQKVRDWAWGKPVEGITMPPVNHQIAITTELQEHTSNWSRSNHFTFKVSDVKQCFSRDGRHHYAVGSYKPFLGHTTKAGVTHPTVELEEKEEVLLAVQNLIDLGSWTESSKMINGVEITSNVTEFINTLVKLYVKKSYTDLAPFANKRKSGTIHHHLRSPSFRESIMPNSLGNMYTFVQGESNSHKTFRETGSHYLMNFLHGFCYAVHQIMIELEVTRQITSPEVVWAVTTPCGFCTRPIRETPIVLDIRRISSVKLNPLDQTIVGRVSMKVFARDMKKSAGKRFIVPQDVGHLSLLNATLGIVSEAYHHHAIRTASLEARYTHHHSTVESIAILEKLIPSNMSKLIGLTEMKKVKISDLVLATTKYVAFNLYRCFTGGSNSTIKTKLRLVPGPSLPWYGLIKLIYEVGRLGEFMYELSKMTNHPLSASSYNVAEAVYVIGQCSIDLQYDEYHLQDIVVLSDYADNLSWPMVQPQLETNKRILITSFYEESGTLCEQDALAFILAVWEPDPEYYLSGMLTAAQEGEALKLEIDTDEYPVEFFEEYTFDDLTTVTVHWLRNLIGTKRLKAAQRHIINNYECLLEKVVRKLNLANFQIVVTNLSDCVSVVRAQEFQILSPSTIEKIAEVGQEILFSRPDESSVVLKYVVPLEHKGLLGYIPKDLEPRTPGEIMINRGYLSRKVGFSTRSASTLSEIFDLFQVTHANFPKQLVMAALGEGRGSMTALIGSIAGAGTCVYMTLPEDDSIEMIPELAVRSTSMNVHYSHILSGIRDVADDLHIESLEEMYPYKYDLVLSDLEPGPIDQTAPDRYEHAISNVIKFYIRNRCNEGKLIMQYYVSSTLTFQNKLRLLSHYIEHIYITHTESIGCRRVIYIVAWGVRRKSPNDNIFVLDDPSESGSRIVSRVARMLTKRYDSRIREPNVDLLRTPRGQTRWSLYMQPLFVNLLERFLGFIIPAKNYTSIRPDDEDMVSIFKSLNFTHRTFGMEVRLQLLKNNATEMRLQSWDGNTRAHRIRILSGLFATHGFLECYRTVISGESTISRDSLKKHYISILQCLDARDRFAGDIEHFGRGLNMDNQPIQYYYYYTRGVITFLSMYAYFYDRYTKPFKLEGGQRPS